MVDQEFKTKDQATARHSSERWAWSRGRAWTAQRGGPAGAARFRFFLRRRQALAACESTRFHQRCSCRCLSAVRFDRPSPHAGGRIWQRTLELRGRCDQTAARGLTKVFTSVYERGRLGPLSSNQHARWSAGCDDIRGVIRAGISHYSVEPVRPSVRRGVPHICAR